MGGITIRLLSACGNGLGKIRFFALREAAHDLEIKRCLCCTQPGHANDLLDRQAVIGHASNCRIGLLAAQKPLVLKLFRLGQNARIDSPGTGRRPDVGHRAAHCSKKGFPGIVEQMPPVCHLEGVRQRSGNGATVTGTAVPGHDLDSGVVIQPSLDCSRFAVRQDIDDPPPFQIADQRSVTPAAPPSSIVNPDRAEMTGRAARTGPDAPKERILADRKQQPLRQCLGRPTTQHEAEMKHRALQPGRSSGIGPCSLGR